jgi:CheY-like chemotaxis protein
VQTAVVFDEAHFAGVRAMMQILVVDDHQLVRKQLRQMIQMRGQWEACGEAADGREAVHQHSVLKPDLIVMDFKMPLLDGLQAFRLTLKDHPSACILVLSVSVSRQLVEEVKKVEIKGFCSKGGMGTFFEIQPPQHRAAVRIESQNQPIPEPTPFCVAICLFLSFLITVRTHTLHAEGSEEPGHGEEFRFSHAVRGDSGARLRKR